MAIHFNLYPKNSDWKDLGPKTRYAERIVKISCAVAALLFLAVAVGSGAATAFDIHFIYPACFGAALAALSAAVAKYANFALFRNKIAPNLNNPAVHDTIVDDLTRNNLEHIYSRIYQKAGGLTPLVQQGYLKPEQGDLLRLYLEEFHAAETLISQYRNAPYISGQINQRRFPQAYKEALDKKEELSAKWETLQLEICQDYGLTPPQFTPPPATPPPEILPSITLPVPTQEAKQWRDVSEETKKAERIILAVTITFIVLAALGIAVAIYFCATTTSTHTVEKTGEVITESNAPLSALPATLGTFFTTIFGAFGFFISNRERLHSGYLWRSLNSQAMRDAYAYFLMQGTLYLMTEEFYRKNGGIAPLVRRGFLTPDQGDRLSRLMRQYKKIQNDSKIYASIQNEMNKVEHLYPNYHYLKTVKMELVADWKKLQEEIKGNFFEEHRVEAPALSAQAFPDWSCTTSLQEGSEPNADLPFELQTIIFSHLQGTDLFNVAASSKNFNNLTQIILEERAKQYEVKREDLPYLFRFVRGEAQKGMFPPQCIVKTASGKVEAEKTLNNLYLLEGEEREKFRRAYGHELLEYTRSGDINKVKAALALGANLELRDEEGDTPLFIAVKLNNEAIIHLLLDAGADPYAINHWGKIPLQHASRSMASKLLEKEKGTCSANFYYNGMSLLHKAAASNDLRRVELLLKHGANPAVFDSQGRTADQLTTRVDISLLIKQAKSRRTQS